MRDQAWPVVPPPFADELFGGWLGRIAGRYGIRVDELVNAAGIEVDLSANGTWLAARPPEGRSLIRLADKCRMSPSDVRSLVAPVRSLERGLPFCYRCLILNPLDVFAPYWKATWSNEDDWTCYLHPGFLERVGTASLKGCGNFPSMFRLLTRRHQRRTIWRASRTSVF